MSIRLFFSGFCGSFAEKLPKELLQRNKKKKKTVETGVRLSFSIVRSFPLQTESFKFRHTQNVMKFLNLHLKPKDFNFLMTYSGF